MMQYGEETVHVREHFGVEVLIYQINNFVANSMSKVTKISIIIVAIVNHTTQNGVLKCDYINHLVGNELEFGRWFSDRFFEVTNGIPTQLEFPFPDFCKVIHSVRMVVFWL